MKKQISKEELAKRIQLLKKDPYGYFLKYEKDDEELENVGIEDDLLFDLNKLEEE